MSQYSSVRADRGLDQVAPVLAVGAVAHTAVGVLR